MKDSIEGLHGGKIRTYGDGVLQLHFPDGTPEELEPAEVKKLKEMIATRQEDGLGKVRVEFYGDGTMAFILGKPPVGQRIVIEVSEIKARIGE